MVDDSKGVVGRKLSFLERHHRREESVLREAAYVMFESSKDAEVGTAYHCMLLIESVTMLKVLVPLEVWALDARLA